MTLGTDVGAAIDWAGEARPSEGTAVFAGDGVSVFARVHKAGVTDDEGQGSNIVAELIYQTDLMASPGSVQMVYSDDVFATTVPYRVDKYVGLIPAAELLGASSLIVIPTFYDLTDGDAVVIEGDMLGNPAPLNYSVYQPLPVDVTVTFSVCLEGYPSSGETCVVGRDPWFFPWPTGVPMQNVRGDLWSVDILVPAGATSRFEYWYRTDDCTNLVSYSEGSSFQRLTLPTDGTTSVVLDVAQPANPSGPEACLAATAAPSSTPRHHLLHTASPNPFNPITTIRYELFRPEAVTLTIHDVTGRKVRTLVAETRDAGVHDVTWRGRDDDGQPVASGVYPYRLRAGSFVESRRMPMLK